jgi:transcriptional regulator with XRE-family HTH domain
VAPGGGAAARGGAGSVGTVTDPAAVTAAVAGNLRMLRTGRGWSLDTLAARSGVSKGILVAVEQARGNPSIATLCRISDALGVALSSLVEVDRARIIKVVLPDQAVPLWHGAPGSTGTLLVGSDPPQHLELWDWRMRAGDGYDGVAHPAGTRELVWVLDGELTLRVGAETAVVPTGAAAVFVADRPHRYANEVSEDLRFAMAVTQPPLPDA